MNIRTEAQIIFFVLFNSIGNRSNAKLVILHLACLQAGVNKFLAVSSAANYQYIDVLIFVCCFIERIIIQQFLQRNTEIGSVLLLFSDETHLSAVQHFFIQRIRLGKSSGFFQITKHLSGAVISVFPVRCETLFQNLNQASHQSIIRIRFRFFKQSGMADQLFNIVIISVIIKTVRNLIIDHDRTEQYRSE